MHVFTGDEGYRALICGETSRSVGSIFEDRKQEISSFVSDSAKSFMGFVRDKVDTIKKYSGLERMAALRNKAKYMFNEDIVHPFSKLDEFLNAKPVMRRWLLAEPTLRSAFHKQSLAGYNGTYVDIEPGKVGEAHYDYRRVTDGMVLFDKEGEWTATTWFEDLLDEDDDLTFDQKSDIQLSWENALAYFNNDIDPTDNEP